MRRLLPAGAALVCVLAAACGGTRSRIRENQERFAAYPPAVQESIRKGTVKPGFTEEQARMAWGEPQRRYERTTDDGVFQVWGYGGRVPEGGPRVGVSVGGATGTGGGVFGGSIGLGGGGGYEYVEERRIVFRDGEVVAVEGGSGAGP